MNVLIEEITKTFDLLHWAGTTIADVGFGWGLHPKNLIKYNWKKTKEYTIIYECINKRIIDLNYLKDWTKLKESTII